MRRPATLRALIDHLDRPVVAEQHHQYHGKVVAADFSYTGCDDIYPALLLRIQLVQERLRRERLLGDKVQLMSFTTDPARDTPRVLRAYAVQHQANPQGGAF